MSLPIELAPALPACAQPTVTPTFTPCSAISTGSLALSWSAPDYWSVCTVGAKQTALGASDADVGSGAKSCDRTPSTGSLLSPLADDGTVTWDSYCRAGTVSKDWWFASDSLAASWKFDAEVEYSADCSDAGTFITKSNTGVPATVRAR
jgi:hypothetical protein